MAYEDFHWGEYCTKLFENNSGLNPSQLWEIVIRDLTASEKTIAFDQGGGKDNLATRRHAWANSKTAHTSHSTTNVASTPHKSAQQAKSGASKGSHGGLKYDYFGELQLPRNTHNPTRSNLWVPLGEWTASDWRHVAAYYYARGKTYNEGGSWANKAAIFLEEKDPTALTGDNWSAILGKLGVCPIISGNLD